MADGGVWSLEGKVAWVTGGAHGIGRATAVALARAGAEVAILDIDAAEAATTADMVRNIGRQALTLNADMNSPEEIGRAADDVVTGLGRLDIAVNNAGIFEPRPALEIDPDHWSRVMGVNLDGVLWCCQAAGRIMAERGRGGRIINVGSMAALVDDWPHGHTAYCVAKAGVVALTRCLAVEWAPEGITVNCISPGNTETEMISQDPQTRARWNEMTPMGRLAKPEEIGGAAVYLASDSAAYTTGHNLVIDGAFTCQ